VFLHFNNVLLISILKRKAIKRYQYSYDISVGI
jgi:hypothetical protein